jgi:hypothetical protein
MHLIVEEVLAFPRRTPAMASRHAQSDAHDADLAFLRVCSRVSFSHFWRVATRM